MSIAFCFSPFFSSSSSNLYAISSSSSSFLSFSSLNLRHSLSSPPLVASSSLPRHCRNQPFVFYSSSSFSTATITTGGSGDDGGNEGDDNDMNEAILALAKVGMSLESLPKDLATAMKDGRIPASSPFFRWLLQFGGFKERLLADDLFLFKVLMECSVGMFTKTRKIFRRAGNCFCPCNHGRSC